MPPDPFDNIDFGATVRGHAPGDRVFDRYELKQLIGRGAMGMVWLAQDERLERPVALKFVPEMVAMDAKAVQDMKRETRRSLDLTHPHIVRIYDFVRDQRTAAIAMEYVDGPTMQETLIKRGERPFSVEEVEPFAKQFCAALDYAHERAKVVHRDLKLANLLTDSRGDLKISDFGIASTLTETTARVSQVANAGGSPVYMSPQQMMGESPTVSDDVYSMGAILYELLTGRPPFYTGNVSMQVLHKVPPTIARRRAELDQDGGPVPEHWERTIAACLAKEPTERPSSAAALWDWLNDPRKSWAFTAIPEPTAATPPANPDEPEPEPDPEPQLQPVSEPVAPPPLPPTPEPVEEPKSDPPIAPQPELDSEPPNSFEPELPNPTPNEIEAPAVEGSEKLTAFEFPPESAEPAPSVVKSPETEREQGEANSAPALDQEDNLTPSTPTSAAELADQSAPEPPPEQRSTLASAHGEAAEASSSSKAVPVLIGLVLLIGLGGAGWWFGYESPRRAEIAATEMEAARLASLRYPVQIDAGIAGSLVVIDGVGRDESPARFEPLPLGEYHARIEAAGYLPQSFSFSINAEGVAPFMVPELSLQRGEVMVPDSGNNTELTLRSVALAAAGSSPIERFGVTPVTESGLPVGTYQVEFRREGWPVKFVDLTVNDGERTVVEPPDFAPAFVQLAGPAPGQTFRVLDSQRRTLVSGTTPQRVELPPGQYTLLARTEDLREWSVEVVVSEGDVIEHRIEFPTASVIVQSEPSGAEVWANGERLGQTPWRADNLGAGRVSFELRLTGRQNAVVSGNAELGEELRLRGVLPAMPAPKTTPAPAPVPRSNGPLNATVRSTSTTPSPPPISRLNDDKPEVITIATPAHRMPKSAVGTAKKSDPPMLRIEVWSLEQVDQKPTVRYQSRLKYPSLMRQRGIEGNVTVEVLVDPFGEVLDATAVDFTRDDFVQAALASVSRWRFRPGKRDGRPVHVRFQIPIEFSLR